MIFESKEIRVERLKLNLTQDELARLSGVSSSRIGKIERKGNATEANLKKLTDALRAGGAT